VYHLLRIRNIGFQSRDFRSRLFQLLLQNLIFNSEPRHFRRNLDRPHTRQPLAMGDHLAFPRRILPFRSAPTTW